MVGIISYGTAIPSYRIKVENIAKAWDKNSNLVRKSLLIEEKCIADKDEDAATLAIDAGIETLNKIELDAQEISAVYVGSESHPYVVKPTSTIVGDALSIGPQYFAADLEFACKAGTAAMQIISGLIEAKKIRYGLSIGSDTAQGAPGDPLEYSAACAAAAFLFGEKEEEIIAFLDETVSFSSDTPDFWRSGNSKYPDHGGRFTGQPGYYHHVAEATKLLLKKTNTNISDYDHVVFHMPNGSFPKRVSKILEVSDKQLEKGYIVPYLGNTYSACSLLGLAAVLDIAKPGEKILMTSYGSGAGSDSFAFTITKNIEKYRKELSVFNKIEQKQYVTYNEYLRMRRKV